MANLSGLSRTSVFVRRASFAPFLRTFAALILIASPALHAQRVTLQTRAQAVAAATDLGVLPDSAPVTLTIRLAPSVDRAAALKQRLADQIDPTSPQYHKWLTPQQFAASFGATDDQVAAATTWLNAQALSVTNVSAAHTALTVTGPAARVESAFAVSLHQMQLSGTTYYANVAQASLPDEAASLIAGVSGLDNLPAPLALTGSAATDVPGALAAALDANTTPILTLTSTTCNADVAPADLDTYTALFQQANAQGVTVIASSACPTGLGAFPASLGEVTAVALTTATAAANPVLLEARPGWQAAPGLPDDQLRHEPDLTASTVDAFTQTISSIALTAGGRLGNINETLYDLAPTPGLYTQADGATAGTWESGSGLGLVDLKKLVEVFPRGTGSSFTSISAAPYSPNYGTSVTFTSAVTSGTGGAIPTGTVSFTTSTGTTLGSGALNASGVATYATALLPAGNTTVTANYSGDATYATSKSPTTIITVNPAPLVLTATVSSGVTVGGTYTVTVSTTTSGSGVSAIGTPTGAVTVTLSGTTTSYTGTWQANSPSSASATITVPATVVGTSSLLISCVGDSNFSCPNPITVTVTVGKATPVLTFSYTPDPPVSGAAIAFTASLAAVGTAPLPTGNVRFFDNGTLINAGTLASGTAQATGTDITAAAHTLSATYDGDANYLTVSLTATAPTATTLTSSSTTNNGQAFTFTAGMTTTLVNGTLPSGTFTLYDGTTVIGTGTVIFQSASIYVTSLSTTVAHSLTAVYSGDTLYASSTSSAITIPIGALTAIATTTAVVPSATQNTGQTFNLTATITPSTVGSVAATGLVRFYDGTVLLGSGTVNSNVATFFQPGLSTKVAHSITANYRGDDNYRPSTSSAVTIAAATTTTTITSSATKNTGQSITFAATVTPSSVVSSTQPTGTIQFMDGTTTLGSPATVTAGTASLVAPALSTTVAHIITGVYSGDTNYPASTSAAVTIGTAATVATTTVITPSATKNTGQSITFAAAITPSSVVSSTQPTGTIQFMDGTTTLGAPATVTAGAASLIAPALSATVAHSITGVYSGDVNYVGSTSAPIAYAASGTAVSVTTVTATPATVASGAAVTYTVTVAASATSTTVPTGTVALTSGGVSLGTVTLVSGAGSVVSTATLASGANVVTATYSGDTTYAASAGTATVMVSTTTVTGTLTAVVAPATGPYNTTAVVTATFALTTGTTIPTGAVVTATYTGIAGTYTGTIAAATGVATITLPVPPPGTYTITVACLASTTFSCTNTVPLSFVATKSASTTSLSINPTTVLGSQVFTLTATVAPSPGVTALTVPPTGTVTFFNNGAAIGTGIVNSSGVATRTTSLASGGTGVYTATYAGDTNYLTSTTASSTSITATKVTPTIVFFSNGSPTLAGLNVIFTIQVTNYASSAGTVPTPSGTVTLYDTSTGIPLFIGTATLGSNGVATGIATFSTTGLFAGTHSIYAVYGGDVNYLPVTSTPVTVDVSDFQLAFYPNTVTVARGGSTSTTIVATPIDQFSGTITMACTPPAAILTTCTITPSTLSGGGQATLTITTTAPGKAAQSGTQAANHPGAWAWRAGSGAMLGMLFFLGIPRARRRKLRSIVVLALALFSIGITANIGCTSTVSNTGSTVVTGGTPLGTAVFTVTAQGQQTIGTVRHSYTLQVTVTP